MGPVRHLVRCVPCRGLRFALVLAACHTPSDGTCVDAPFTVRDSAGVVIATTGECDALRPLGWSVALEPDLELGKKRTPLSSVRETCGDWRTVPSPFWMESRERCGCSGREASSGFRCAGADGARVSW